MATYNGKTNKLKQILNLCWLEYGSIVPCCALFDSASFRVHGENDLVAGLRPCSLALCVKF